MEHQSPKAAGAEEPSLQPHAGGLPWLVKVKHFIHACSIYLDTKLCLLQAFIYLGKVSRAERPILLPGKVWSQSRADFTSPEI